MQSPLSRHEQYLACIQAREDIGTEGQTHIIPFLEKHCNDLEKQRLISIYTSKFSKSK